MSPKTILMILIAGGLSIAVILATRSFLTSAQQGQPVAAAPAPKQPDTKIWVAKKDLPIGTILAKTDVEAQEWPKAAFNDAYVRSGTGDDLFEGHVVRAVMTKGEPLTRSSLIKQGERGFMAAVLAPSMRAVTVNLTPVASVGGFLFPGDRVDVILTHAIDTREGVTNTLSETVLQNVRVLAVDQRAESDTTEVALRRTATLEVTPRMAEKLALLERVGQLSLSLRGLQAQADSMTQNPVDRNASYTFDADISRFIDRPNSGNKATVRVRRGSAVSRVTTTRTSSLTDANDSDAVTISSTRNNGSSDAVTISRTRNNAEGDQP